MNATEHYRRAEELLEGVRQTAIYMNGLTDDERVPVAEASAPLTANLIAHAQAHATLALAGVTSKGDLS